MRKYTGLFASLTLGMALAAGAPVLAQQAPAPAAAAGVNLAPGTIVHDSEGKEIGPISSAEGGTVVVTFGDKQAPLPANAFMQTDKGTAITLTLAQLTAALAQQDAAMEAQLTAALQPGTDIRGVNGNAIIGKVKSSDAEGVVVASTQGDVRLPRKAFFVGAQGLATSFTAEQFAAAVAEAGAGASAQPGAVADADGAADAESAAKPAD
jgi:hypothetical protein